MGDLFCKYYWYTLVGSVVKQLTVMMKYYKDNNEPEICDDIAQCLELGNKLLYFNYSKKSDELSNKVDDLIKSGDTFAAFDEDFRCSSIYSKEWKEAEKDLKKFFKLVGEYAGEWL